MQFIQNSLVKKSTALSNSFSIEVPDIGHVNKKLIIEQSSEGLKILIQSNDREISTIPKYMIVGLPKVDLVPKEFFDTCSARLVALERGSKVYFNTALKGGVFCTIDTSALENQVNTLQNQLRSVIGTIQANASEVIRIYNSVAGINDVAWHVSWGNLNNELSQTLNAAFCIEQKKLDIRNNIEKRIVFYRDKRQALTGYKF